MRSGRRHGCVIRDAARRMPGWVGVALPAVGSGVLWALAAPPRGWWPLFPLGVAALAVTIHGRPRRVRALCAALAGGTYYSAALAWLAGFAPPGYVAVAVLETAMLVGAILLLPTSPARAPWPTWWGLPGALVLVEAAQTRFPFGGFPLPAFSLSQVGGPFVLAAPVGGALLVTALAAFTGSTLAAVVLHPRGAVGRGTAWAVLLALVLTLGAAAPALTTRPAGRLDSAVVQGGGPRGIPAVATDPRATTERQLAVLRQVTGSPDVVLLPETAAVVQGPLAGTPIDARLAALARGLGTALVVGVAETDGDRFRNAAVLWAPDGRRVGRYEKQHRVPFGEYIPLRGLLEQLTDLTALVPRDALVGTGPAILGPPPRPLGVVISYEVFFADRVRDAVAAGGQLVLVPTNAASYVTEQVPAIEVAAARLRAREFGRAVLQAAPTGYSAVIDPSGAVVARSGLETPALLRQEITLRTGETPYARFGDLPAMIAAAAALLVPILPRTRRRRPGGAGATADPLTPIARPTGGGRTRPGTRR